MENTEKKTGNGNFQDGQWVLENLSFLNDFMLEVGLTTTTAGEKIGVARQSVYHWFKTDNCKMSNIYDLVEACGYEITFTLEKSRTEGLTMNVKRDRGEKRLSFLDDALNRYGISKADMARKINMATSSVFHWFETDDCFIKYVNRIAKEYNLKLLIDIRAKQV